jgi:hypothetical protein
MKWEFRKSLHQMPRGHGSVEGGAEGCHRGSAVVEGLWKVERLSCSVWGRYGGKMSCK